MTTKKHGPSLYEVLKDTLRKRELERQRLAAMTPAAAETAPPVDEEAPPIDEPAPSAIEIPAEPEPAAETPIEEPVAPPPPIPEPEPVMAEVPVAEPEPPARRWRGLGERTVVMTYNTAAFGGLVLLLTMVAAYSAGLSRGRTEPEAAPAEPTPPATTVTRPSPPPPSPAPAPAPQWKIRVFAWEVPSADPAHHRVAAVLRRQLEQAGFKDLRVETAPVAGGRFAAVLTCGAFADRHAPDAQEVFRRLGQQNFRGTALGRQLAFVRY